MKDLNQDFETSQQAVYQIKVLGRMDAEWSDWFEGMEISIEKGEGDQWVTKMTGVIQDQAALQGILSRIGTLNLKLISVTQIKMNSN
jgi:hypothetical protein